MSLAQLSPADALRKYVFGARLRNEAAFLPARVARVARVDAVVEVNVELPASGNVGS